MLSRGKVREAEPIAGEQTSQDLEVSQRLGHTLTNGKAALRGGIEDVKGRSKVGSAIVNLKIQAKTKN